MKFSIIIPTQNRPELIAQAVHYALAQNYQDIEVIVSDNSTTADFKAKNKLILAPFMKTAKFSLVSPPDVLSAPDHFEFALQDAKGDYVLYLTDKMILLPNTLHAAEMAISQSGAEIVSWRYLFFTPDDPRNLTGAGTVTHDLEILGPGYREYDPIAELASKARGATPRASQSIESYAIGKLCFGCFSKDLISRIKAASSGLFDGCTHDYSAMVQGLCAAKKCVVLDSPGIVFFLLPIETSWGMLTHLQSSSALTYYQTFKDPERMIRSLFVPGLYSSSHNMVAHDYLKFLGLYGREDLFVEKNWLCSIGRDLFLPNKIWSSELERQTQIELFFAFLNRKLAIKTYYYFDYYVDRLSKSVRATVLSAKRLLKKTIALLGPFGEQLLNKKRRRKSEALTASCSSLEAALSFLHHPDQNPRVM